MALEAIVYPQDPFSYISCKDLPLNDSLFHQEEDTKNNIKLGQEQRQVQGLGLHDDYNNYNDEDLLHWPQDDNLAYGSIVDTENQPPPPLEVANGGGGGRRKRRRTRNNKNKEEIENQRMTHIAVERNRRKQMNEYLAVLRSLMPPSYAQRGDQASIVGGAINYLKELEHHLQTMNKPPIEESTVDKTNIVSTATSSSGTFLDFFAFPQYSSCPTSATVAEGTAEIEVTMVESHASVKILAKKRPRQLLKLVASIQNLRLTLLHLNVTTRDSFVLYSISLKSHRDEVMEKFMDNFLKRKAPETSYNIDLDNLPSDPADRKRIIDYHPNQRDEVIRKYLIMGPCQPRGHTFKQIPIGNTMRRFNPDWFDEYPNWLEYSVKKEKAFCMCCYLFRDNTGKNIKRDAFITEGFSGWNKYRKSFTEHVGPVDSFHNNAVMKCENLLKQDQSIKHALHKQDGIVKNEYRIRLNASIDVARILLQQGLPFRGHDETEDSSNRGNFVEFLKYTAQQNEIVSKVVLENAPGNNQMSSPNIQKDIVHCFAETIIKSIIEEIDNDVFGLLVDESADVSNKEQMAVVFRFVAKTGIVKERFISITHVSETSSATLKLAIDSLFTRYGLSIKKLRGQGYDGASNMKGEFNGLKALILKENASAYYVHCFAHQLQLVVVAVAKKHFDVGDFFDMISLLLNVVGASCKRKDMLAEKYRKTIEEGISDGEINTGTGLNQDISLQRPGATRWGSHYKTLLRLVELFSPIVEVLEYVQNEGVDDSKRRQAHGLLRYFHRFDFVFYLQMMVHLLGLTYSLSMVLQKKDQDILNAMSLVKSTKRQLQQFRDDGWNSLMMKVSSFCQKHDIENLDMEEEFVDSRKPRAKTGVKNMHHYKVNCLYVVLDLQMQEFNDRFNEVNTELLIYAASLSPVNSFSDFDHSKLMKLSQFYPNDFSHGEFISLEQQLHIYIDNVRNDERFISLKNLGELAHMLVETRKHLSHPLVYRLLKLVLILPVATATVERCFSAMKIVKTHRRNRIGDQFLNDCLVCFIEKDIFKTIINDNVIEIFQKMKERRIIL